MQNLKPSFSRSSIGIYFSILAAMRRKKLAIKGNNNSNTNTITIRTIALMRNKNQRLYISVALEDMCDQSEIFCQTQNMKIYFVMLMGHQISEFCRSSRLKVFCKKAALRNVAKFTGKHLCQGLFLKKVGDLHFFILLDFLSCNKHL